MTRQVGGDIHSGHERPSKRRPRPRRVPPPDASEPPACRGGAVHVVLSRVSNVVLVFFGGALGSVSRYLVASWAATTWGPDFPRGTLIVNVVGSFLISVVMGLSLETAAISPPARLFLTTGIMGGFTTYSSFNYETLHLLEEGLVGRALLNMGITLTACLASGALGLALARLAVRAGSP